MITLCPKCMVNPVAPRSLSEHCASCTRKTKPEITTSKTGSLRYNQGKPEVTQLDPEFILELARLMTESAKKYSKYNWAKGQELCTPLDSAFRHLFAFAKGEDTDKESGFLHVMHAAANMMIIYRTLKLKNPELDDRYTWGKNE